jgi:hypothetical protein
VGKTMFIRHLLRVDAAEELRGSLVFYVDFGREPSLSGELQAHIIESVIRQLDEEHGIDIHSDGFVRAAYNREINRFRRGIYGPLQVDDPAEYRKQEIAELGRLTGDPGKHLERALQHLEASAQRRSVIVLDNIDQRPSEFQDEIFVIAQTMSSTLASTIFVSLRPTTFFESKLRGSLAAYQPRAFHVAPARVSNVIAKRLAFARKQLLEGATESDLSLDVRDLKAYLDALEAGFTTNETLLEILENMSGGNTRLALEYLSSFVGSGYVDTARILDVAERGSVYTIPVHEFMRSIILGENEFYDPTTSRIPNVFDISIADQREHFLLLLLLAFVQTAGESSASSSHGFVESQDVYATAQAWGFLPEQIQWQLERAVSKSLIDTDADARWTGPYRISSVGAYMYREMVAMFSYVDSMIVDTPIVDPSARSAILDVRAIEERLDRADQFCDYLEDVWQAFPNPESLPFDWNVQGAGLRRDISTAREKAERARSKRIVDG